MRGFKAKALRRLAKELVGEEEPMYMTEPVRGKEGPTHINFLKGPDGSITPIEVINPIVRVDKWYRLYKKMKRELSHGAL